jgi:hypothetical protein
MTIPRDQRPMVAVGENYRPGLDGLDGRTIIARAIRQGCDEIIADQGGEDGMSTIRRKLIRRFMGVEILIEANEAKLVDGAEIDIAAHTTLLNAYVRLAKTLGIDRQARRVRGMREHIAAKQAANGAAA